MPVYTQSVYYLLRNSLHTSVPNRSILPLKFLFPRGERRASCVVLTRFLTARQCRSSLSSDSSQSVDLNVTRLSLTLLLTRRALSRSAEHRPSAGAFRSFYRIARPSSTMRSSSSGAITQRVP